MNLPAQETIRETIREEPNATIRERPEDSKTANGIVTGSDFRGHKIIKQMPSNSTEADIFVIAKDKAHFILKLYRYGIEPKAEILKTMQSLSKAHPKEFVHVLESDYDPASKRWFEIQEYIKNGSLQVVMNSLSKLGEPQRKAFFNYTAREIGQALSILHKNNLLHLDLKPSNILIRSLKPFNLVLIDFGISTLLGADMSKKFTQTRGTPMYQSPESWAGSMNRASDWWGLGMILLEIASCRHPFSGLDYKVIASIMATRSVEIPENIDEGQKEILRGLLTRDPDKRWKWEQVYRWLKGERNIPTFFEADTKSNLPEPSDSNVKPIVFMGKKYRALNGLAAAFAANEETWEKGRAFLMRGYVARWLEEAENYDIVTDIDKIFSGVDDSDSKTFRFIDHFGEKIPFIFCGHLVTLKNMLLITGKALKREKLTAMEKKFADSVSNGVLLSCADFYLKKHSDSAQAQLIREALQNLNGKSIKDVTALLDFYMNPKNYYCPFMAGEINSQNAIKSSSLLQCLPLRLEDWQKINVNDIVPMTLLQNMKSAVSYYEFFAGGNLAVMLKNAIRHKSPEIIKLLQRLGADTNIILNDAKENGITNLLEAARHNAYEVAYLLIDNGADVNCENYNGFIAGFTALMCAACNNAYEVAKLLIDNGANNFDSALIEAVSANAYEVAKLLIDNGADVNTKNNTVWTALMSAASANAYEIAKLLIDNGADVNRKDDVGDTPLIHAAKKNAYEVAKLLIDNGADVNFKNNRDDTVFILAAFANAYEVVKLLIDNGADVNCKNNIGSTALMGAAQENAYEVAKLLIDNGADVNCENYNGVTALKLARAAKAYKIAELIESKMSFWDKLFS